MPSNLFSPRYAICWFHIFTFFREISKFQNRSILKFCACHPCNQCVVLLFVIELLIYCKKYFLMKQNKNYWSIYKSILINRSTRFRCSFDEVETTLKKHWHNIVSTLCNIVLTLFQRRAPALYQRCATLKIWSRILFHFRSIVNVISMFDPKRWNNIHTALK